MCVIMEKGLKEAINIEKVKLESRYENSSEEESQGKNAVPSKEKNVRKGITTKPMRYSKANLQLNYLQMSILNNIPKRWKIQNTKFLRGKELLNSSQQCYERSSRLSSN